MFKETITQIRRNHALEHGTVAVLMERGVAPPLGGYSTRRGFFILGRASAELVEEAAGEALARIVDGQRQLAISRHCGTNLVTSAVLAGLFTAILMRRLGKEAGPLSRIPAVAVAAVGANILGRPIGNELQRRFTTLPDLAGVEIVDVRAIWKRGYALHRVTTSFAPPQ